jgi:hypothetical protein
MSTKPLSDGEWLAMSAIAKARNENLRNLFDGTELTFAKYSRQKSIKNALSDAASLASQTRKLVKGVQSGSTTASAISQAGDIHSNGVEFIQIASGITDYSDVVSAVSSEVLHSLVSEMTPFIGVITSSLKSVSSWRAVVANARDLYKSDYYLEGVLPGDPSAAAEAVIETIKRFLAANTAEAVANTASAATKIAGLFADLGTATTAAVGAARAAAKLIQELAILGRDYRDMKAGNALLKDPGRLNLNVFKVCPILGCYLIACSDSSMVLNFFVADIGLPGWMTKIEKMKKSQLDPLIKNATKAIVSSHLTLEGLKTTKGTVAPKGTLALLKDNIKYHFNQLIKSNSTRSAGV